jgi:hypothetical protein
MLTGTVNGNSFIIITYRPCLTHQIDRGCVSLSSSIRQSDDGETVCRPTEPGEFDDYPLRWPLPNPTTEEIASTSSVCRYATHGMEWQLKIRDGFLARKPNRKSKSVSEGQGDSNTVANSSTPWLAIHRNTRRIFLLDHNVTSVQRDAQAIVVNCCLERLGGSRPRYSRKRAILTGRDFLNGILTTIWNEALSTRL